MNKRTLAICLAAILLLSGFTNTAHVLAETKDDLHRYLDIPYFQTTDRQISDILLEKKGVSLELHSGISSGLGGRLDGIKDFGYEFNLQLDVCDNRSDVDRIILSSAQTSRVATDEFYDRTQSDFMQFIDMDQQLTALYGEPDDRCFSTNHPDYFVGAKTRYMFESGEWTLPDMMGVCERGIVLHFYSVWGNVLLESWVDWKKPNSGGDYLTRIILYYYPRLIDTTKIPVAIYSPTQAF